jgi:LAO/AO transport system kinase
MEIADMFVVNKSDRPGADNAITSINTILMMKDHTADSWLPGTVKAIASENFGITEIVDEINRHRAFLEKTGLLLKKREDNSKSRIKEIVHDFITREIWNMKSEEELESHVGDVVTGKLSPYNLANQIINNFKSNL